MFSRPGFHASESLQPTSSSAAPLVLSRQDMVRRLVSAMFVDDRGELGEAWALRNAVVADASATVSKLAQQVLPDQCQWPSTAAWERAVSQASLCIPYHMSAQGQTAIIRAALYTLSNKSAELQYPVPPRFLEDDTQVRQVVDAFADTIAGFVKANAISLPATTSARSIAQQIIVMARNAPQPSAYYRSSFTATVSARIMARCVRALNESLDWVQVRNGVSTTFKQGFSQFAPPLLSRHLGMATQNAAYARCLALGFVEGYDDAVSEALGWQWTWKFARAGSPTIVAIAPAYRRTDKPTVPRDFVFPRPLPSESPIPRQAAPTSASSALRQSAQFHQAMAWIPWNADAGSRMTMAWDAPAHEREVSVGDFGAMGRGDRDDTQAIQRAIDAVSASGGVVRFAVGVYRLSSPLYIRASRVRLIGAGSASTELRLDKSLTDCEPRLASNWSWSGGMIWFAANGHVIPDAPVPSPAYRSSIGDCWVVDSATQGSRTIRVSALTPMQQRAFAPGTPIELVYYGDAHLLATIAADPAFATYPWNNLTIFWPDDRFRLILPAKIERVEGNSITLHAPLRLPISEQTPTELRTCDSWTLHQVGIQGLRMVAPERKNSTHLQEPGFNGVYMNGCLDGFVNDVHGVNLDSCLILDRASHVSASRLSSTGSVRAHHFVSLRNGSHCNLIEHFVLNQRVQHGISLQDFSAGNVFRAGIMHHGTFDSHRGMPFDSIRSDIAIFNDGGPGGTNTSGPFQGRRMVHWNIRIVGGRSQDPIKWGRWIYQPQLHPFGALIGITGAPPLRDEALNRSAPSHPTETPFMAPGIVSALDLPLDPGINVPDLFQWQCDQP